MLDPKLIREEKDRVHQRLLHRGEGAAALFHTFFELDVQWRHYLQRLDALRNERTQLAPKGKPTPEQLEVLTALSDQIKALQDKVQGLEQEVTASALYLPNIPDASVPLGASESDNVEISKCGDLPSFAFEPKSHDELGGQLGILAFEDAAKITGSRFVIYKGAGAKLERALISFMLDVHTSEHGYEEILPPAIVHERSLKGTGQLPKFADDSFKLEDTEYWLSPTAEVQLTNMVADSILNAADLPLKLTAFTPCFRKEAGSYGKDMKGLIRLHQFHKVELVQIVSPEDSDQALESLTAHAERILQLLKLPYRKILLCTGDMGFSSAKTYDLEVWFPSQHAYREISSCSKFLDFQARRAMIRCRDSESGKVRYAHTLNGSGLAVGRTLAAILENYQLADGSVVVPDVLKPYMALEKISVTK